MLQETAQNLMEITKESYEKIAGDFSSTRNFSWLEIDKTIEKYLKDDIKILDLGCGNGRLLLSLKKYLKNFDYTGVDSCVSLIEKARLSFTSPQLPILSFPPALPSIGQAEQESRNIAFECGNILKLNTYTDNSFDVVFMVASFNHIPSKEWREKLLNDIQKILKPGGFLIMTNWNLWNLNNKKSFWRNLLKNHFTNYLPHRQAGRLQITDYKEVVTLWQNQFPLYYHAFTLDELKNLLIKVNLKILTNTYMRNGKKAHWFNGKNILTIGQKK